MPIFEVAGQIHACSQGAGKLGAMGSELTPLPSLTLELLGIVREYDAMHFWWPQRTGKTIGLIDGWIVYTIVCGSWTCSLCR